MPGLTAPASKPCRLFSSLIALSQLERRAWLQKATNSHQKLNKGNHVSGQIEENAEIIVAQNLELPCVQF